MTEYITTDTELTSVANAIRTKGGTEANLTYPTDFVNAIDAINGGGGFDIGDLCYFVDTNTFFGLAYLKYGDLTLYDNDSDAPYLNITNFSAAMNMTIVLRLLDSAYIDEFSFDGIYYGESSNPNIELDESAYTWDSNTGYLTITIPSFEAEEPVISPIFTYQS